MAGLPKLPLFCPEELFQTKHFSFEIIFFPYESLTFRDKIVTSGKTFGQGC